MWLETVRPTYLYGSIRRRFSGRKSIEGASFRRLWWQIGKSTNIAKVSVVGVGMRSILELLRHSLKLSNAGINMLMISTSEIKISVAVSPEHGDEATRVAHVAFGLGK